MIALLIFNVFLIALASGIATRILPPSLYTGLLEALHITVGITTPPREKLWIFAVVWIVSIVVLTDGLVLVFFFLLRQLK